MRLTAFLTTERQQALPARICADATFSLENAVNAISTPTIPRTIALPLVPNRCTRLDHAWRPRTGADGACRPGPRRDRMTRIAATFRAFAAIAFPTMKR